MLSEGLNFPSPVTVADTWLFMSGEQSTFGLLQELASTTGRKWLVRNADEFKKRPPLDDAMKMMTMMKVNASRQCQQAGKYKALCHAALLGLTCVCVLCCASLL